MFLCSLERKFPGKFKTHPTFISSPLPKAQNIIYKRIPLFRGKPCSSLKMASYQLKCINYQMDHIWLAPGRLKNSPGVLIGSQCSRTLYRSFIMTLQIKPNILISFYIILKNGPTTVHCSALYSVKCQMYIGSYLSSRN